MFSQHLSGGRLNKGIYKNAQYNRKLDIGQREPKNTLKMCSKLLSQPSDYPLSLVFETRYAHRSEPGCRCDLPIPIAALLLQCRILNPHVLIHRHLQHHRHHLPRDAQEVLPKDAQPGMQKRN